MPRIAAIKNITVTAEGSATDIKKRTDFGFLPHEAIIRQISYMGPNAQEPGTFLIWSSLINDYIGSFQVNNYGTVVNPNIHILITSPLPNELTFRIDTVDATGQGMPYTALIGDFVMHIDFIKYA